MMETIRDRKQFRQRLLAGEGLLGAFCPSPGPELIEVAAFAGFDFAVADAEHGPITIADVVHMVRAGHSCDIAMMVRVPEFSADFVMRSLDAGADGIILPQVESPEEVRRLVEAMHYPPAGNRGLGYYVRAHHFTRTLGAAAMEPANARVVTGILIETPKGVENIDAIMAVEGLDLVLMGTGDLSVTIGAVPDAAQAVEDAVRHVAEAGKRHGVATAIAVPSADVTAKHAQQGYQVVVTGLLPPLLRYCSDFVRVARSNLDA